MTDSRCVNPRYAEDVDIMMIEYSAHNAVVSQLELLKVLSGTQYPRSHGALELVLQPAETAARLSEVYEVFINIFRQSHGVEKLPEATRLDGALLKFLTLLNTWVRCRVDNFEGRLFHIAPEMLTALRQDQIINNFLRQRWLHTRSSPNTVSGLALHSSVPVDQRQPQGVPADDLLAEVLCLRDHLISQFIHISRRMQPKEAQLTEKWMLLASRFMIHAALEVMDAPGRLDNNGVRIAVQQCFAWGHVPRNKYGSDSPLRKRLLAEVQGDTPKPTENAAIQQSQDMVNQALVLEDDCCEMFRDVETSEDCMEVDGPRSPGELPDWTGIRQEALDAVLSAVAGRTSEDRTTQIQWLRNEYRLSTLLDDIVTFLSISWGKYHSDEWHGKPILIQIEQGGLSGMTNEEFDAFKHRAGIL